MSDATVLFSSVIGETPEGQWEIDVLTNYRYGYYGDIELYNNPVLLVKRAIEDAVDDAIINGSGVG